MQQSQQMDRLKKVRAIMLVKHPFFATLMMSMPMVETEEIPTAATDMKSLFVNPAFVDSIDNDTLMFVIAHEIMHTALSHGLRLQQRNKMRWNVATDYAINLILKDSGFKIWPQALLDDKWKDMSADAIYNSLTNDEGKSGKGQPGAGEPGSGHESPMLGDLIEPDTNGDPVAEDQLRKEIQQRVAQAAAIARMTGNMPGSLERFVSEVLEPKVPWHEMLRHLMTEFDKADEDWMHRNRRFSVYLPSDRSEDRLGVAVGIGDTSGSIGNDELRDYSSEFVGICEQTRPEEIRMVWADARVAGEQVFAPGDDVDLKPQGGGGTDMRVPLKYAEQFEPRIVVLFTDGHTPWPTEPPPYPLIVCCTTQVHVPIGEVVRI